MFHRRHLLSPGPDNVGQIGPLMAQETGHGEVCVQAPMPLLTNSLCFSAAYEWRSPWKVNGRSEPSSWISARCFIINSCGKLMALSVCISSGTSSLWPRWVCSNCFRRTMAIRPLMSTVRSLPPFSLMVMAFSRRDCSAVAVPMRKHAWMRRPTQRTR